MSTDPMATPGSLDPVVELSCCLAGKGGQFLAHGKSLFFGNRPLDRGHPPPTLKIHHASIAKFQHFVELKEIQPPTQKEYVRYVGKGVAPLHAARTSQRDVPTTLNRYK